MRNSGVLQKIELIVFLNSEIDMNKSLNIKWKDSINWHQNTVEPTLHIHVQIWTPLRNTGN